MVNFAWFFKNMKHVLIRTLAQYLREFPVTLVWYMSSDNTWLKFHTTNTEMIKNAHFISILKAWQKTRSLHSWVTYFQNLFQITSNMENNHCAIWQLFTRYQFFDKLLFIVRHFQTLWNLTFRKHQMLLDALYLSTKFGFTGRHKSITSITIVLITPHDSHQTQIQTCLLAWLCSPSFHLTRDTILVRSIFSNIVNRKMFKHGLRQYNLITFLFTPVFLRLQYFKFRTRC